MIVEIKVHTTREGRKYALWRFKGGRSLTWHGLGVNAAERGIRDGQVSIRGVGVVQCVPAPEGA